jgi:hypothetical protein
VSGVAARALPLAGHAPTAASRAAAAGARCVVSAGLVDPALGQALDVVVPAAGARQRVAEDAGPAQRAAR